MKSRTAHILTAVSVAFLLTVSSAPLFAQAGAGGAGGAGGGAGAAGGAGPGASGAANARSPSGQAGNATAGAHGGNWSTANVTANDPFGTIDTKAAGTTPESMRTWAQGRSEAERTELMGRCGVINEQTNAQHYSNQAQQFCRNFMTASAGQRGGAAGGSTTR